MAASAGTGVIASGVYLYRRNPACGRPSRARSTIASLNRREVSSLDRQACTTSIRRKNRSSGSDRSRRFACPCKVMSWSSAIASNSSKSRGWRIDRSGW
jgi:hypothetical protein